MKNIIFDVNLQNVQSLIVKQINIKKTNTTNLTAKSNSKN